MTRHIPGLPRNSARIAMAFFEGFVLGSRRSSLYRWHARKPFLACALSSWSPKPLRVDLSRRLYCTDRALWKLKLVPSRLWHDPELLSRDQVDEKAVRNLSWSFVRTSHVTLNGTTLSYQNLEAFAPRSQSGGTSFQCDTSVENKSKGSGDDLLATRARSASTYAAPGGYRLSLS